MSAHERHLAQYSRQSATLSCDSCGHEWDGAVVSEYGMSWYEPHEQCPRCGSDELTESEPEGPDPDAGRDEEGFYRD